jgi:hypothetical protein
MNKLALFTSIAGLACALSAQATVYVDGVKLNFGGSAPYQSNQGGEFKATLQNGLQTVIPISQYSAVTLNGYGANQVPTFCLESSEFITQGGVYDVILNDQAVAGGAAPQMLTQASAFLYYAFAKGTLTGYAFTGTTTARKASADALQKAIWYFEGEGSNPGNSFVTLALSTFGSLANAQMANFNGTSRAYPVAVMNLWANGTTTPPTGYAQDQIVLVPEPSTYIAGGLALLPLLFGLRARFQRK